MTAPPPPTAVSPAKPGRAPAPQLRPTLAEERRLWRSGHRWVAGLDEVGRGAWAGPVTVGVAVLNPGLRTGSMPRWLRDSKLLAEERRESVFGEVARWCADGAVGHASAAECDRWGMTMALRLAAFRALAALELAPGAILIDGPYNLLREPGAPPPAGAAVVDESDGGGVEVVELPLDLGGPAAEGAGGGVPPPMPVPMPPMPQVPVPATVLPVVDGDAKCAAVAAASVLAKVTRDRLMREAAPHFPPYDFERNKGYPSPAHKLALRGYGLSAIHRRSWAYVDDLPWGGLRYRR
ncbi:MAG: ribonuclease HII [Acidimicrobiales bacterium]